MKLCRKVILIKPINLKVSSLLALLFAISRLMIYAVIDTEWEIEKYTKMDKQTCSLCFRDPDQDVLAFVVYFTAGFRWPIFSAEEAKMVIGQNQSQLKFENCVFKIEDIICA